MDRTRVAIIAARQSQHAFVCRIILVYALDHIPQGPLSVSGTQVETATGPFGRGNDIVCGQLSENLGQIGLGHFQLFGQYMDSDFSIGIAVNAQVKSRSDRVFTGFIEHKDKINDKLVVNRKIEFSGRIFGRNAEGSWPIVFQSGWPVKLGWSVAFGNIVYFYPI